MGVANVHRSNLHWKWLDQLVADVTDSELEENSLNQRFSKYGAQRRDRWGENGRDEREIFRLQCLPL